MDLVWREEIDEEDILFTSLGCFHVFLSGTKKTICGPPSAVFTRSNLAPSGLGTVFTIPPSEVIRSDRVAEGGDVMSKCHNQSFLIPLSDHANINN